MPLPPPHRHRLLQVVEGEGEAQEGHDEDVSPLHWLRVLRHLPGADLVGRLRDGLLGTVRWVEKRKSLRREVRRSGRR